MNSFGRAAHTSHRSGFCFRQCWKPPDCWPYPQLLSQNSGFCFRQCWEPPDCWPYPQLLSQNSGPVTTKMTRLVSLFCLGVLSRDYSTQILHVLSKSILLSPLHRNVCGLVMESMNASLERKGRPLQWQNPLLNSMWKLKTHYLATFPWPMWICSYAVYIMWCPSP